MNKKIIALFLIIISCFVMYDAFTQNNTLTAKEKQDWWKLLFDGKDLQQWHSYLQDKPGKACQVKDGAIFLNKDVSVPGTNGARLCRNMIASPIIPIVCGFSLSRSPSTIKPKPMVAITSKRKTSKCTSNQSPKFTKVNSNTISHNPLVNKNFLVLLISFL